MAALCPPQQGMMCGCYASFGGHAPFNFACPGKQQWPWMEKTCGNCHFPWRPRSISLPLPGKATAAARPPMSCRQSVATSASLGVAALNFPSLPRKSGSRRASSYVTQTECGCCHFPWGSVAQFPFPHPVKRQRLHVFLCCVGRVRPLPLPSGRPHVISLPLPRKVAAAMSCGQSAASATSLGAATLNFPSLARESVSGRSTCFSIAWTESGRYRFPRQPRSISLPLPEGSGRGHASCRAGGVWPLLLPSAA